MIKEQIQHILLGIGIAFCLLIIFFLFGKLHLILFILLIGCSYKLTDYYLLTVNNPDKTFGCWPNLLVFFDVTKDPKEELQQKQITNSNYIQKNPWIHLMLSKQLDTTLDEFCCLCLRDYIYPWLLTITHDDSLVYEIRHLIRYFLATIIRRLQNADINRFVSDRFFPLIFQTCHRYLQTRENLSSSNSIEFVRQMYKDDLHLAIYNRQTELKYLKELLVNLMPILAPKCLSDCQGSRHFLQELISCQIILQGIDNFCHPNTINRLFYLFFITFNQSSRTIPCEQFSSNKSVEILSHFCAMNGQLHKNHLALELTDVMYEKELMNQFSRVLDREGSLGLLSIYLSLTDFLNDIPLASDILVRKKIYQRLKHIDERYLNPNQSDTYLLISNPWNIDDKLINEMKYLIDYDLKQSIEDNNRIFNVQQAFTLLSRFHCKVYELIEEKYQRAFINSDEHFYYICGRRMDSLEYRTSEQNFDEIALDFIQIDEIRNPTRQDSIKHYTTTSYQEMEEKDDAHLKCPEDTMSISSATSVDERDLSTWRVRIDHIEELKENLNSNTKYFAFIIEVQRLDSTHDNPLVNDEERTHWIVARRFQDFYLLEQKLTEFHGIFYDARLPTRRSASQAKNLEYLESIRNDFEHFLRHLISKPTLRNSELLYNFLTQPDEFTLPTGEIILTKMFKVVPRALRIEKGQSLEPFLISLLSYIEPSKPKATQPSPTFVDIIEEQLKNSIYGNNANVNEHVFESTDKENDNTQYNDFDTTYDHLNFIVQKIFSKSIIINNLLNFLRVPLKNTFNMFFSSFMENKIEEILNDEENIIAIIHALRDTLFPNDAKDSTPIDLVNFDDVIAAADEFIPNTIKILFGKTNVLEGLQILLQHFQDPLLNKQLFYTMLDEIICELFPELQLHSNTSRTNTMTT